MPKRAKDPKQGSLFEPTEEDWKSAEACDDLGAYAQQWARDVTRAEKAAIQRFLRDHPRRYMILDYVVLSMGGRGWTDVSAAQIARECGWPTEAAARKHLRDLYEQEFLAVEGAKASHEPVTVVVKGKPRTVKPGTAGKGRRIVPGERLNFYRMMAAKCDFSESKCDSQTRASVTSGSHTPKKEKPKKSAAGRRSESAGVAPMLPEALPADDATSAAALAEARERLRRITPDLRPAGLRR